MPNENTSYLKLPLPHPDNLLEGDVFRIRDAFIALDVDSGNQDQKLSQHAQFLENLDALKADKDALPLPSDAMDSTSSTTAASSKAVKTAHDRAVAAQAAANNAQSTANGRMTADFGNASTVLNVAHGGTGRNNGTVSYADSAGNAGNGVPRGIICMWSGAVNAVPSGWALCNGQNGTPNLLDRMIIGAGGSYASGANGGSTTHGHSLSGTVGGATLSEGQLASHRHKTWAGQNTGGGHGIVEIYNLDGVWIPDGVIGATGSSQSHAHSLSASTGNASNLPPYYALAYIMRL